MRHPLPRPRLIVVSGLDGTGKSTHAKALVEDLRARGFRTLYRRLRFPFVLSVPLLILARLRGRSYVLREGRQAVRVHAFGSSPFLRLLFPMTVFVDLLLVTWILVRLPMALGWTVVCDRFVADTLVDVAASCEMETVPSSLRDLFESLVPDGTTALLLTASSAILLQRRPELALDPSFSRRVRLYDELADAVGLEPVETEGKQHHVHQALLSQLIQTWPALESRPPTLSARWYARLNRDGRPRKRDKVLLLLTHWLFQSLGSMGRTERALKAAIGIAVFVPLFLALLSLYGPLLAGVVAAGLAHSVNFLLNAHIPVVLKYTDLQVGQGRLKEYVTSLSTRVRDRRYLEGAVAIGSLARDSLQPNSDLDVRVIPRPGLINALRAGLFVLGERARALRRVFPLDIYMAENPPGLHAILAAEEPRILSDNRGILRGSFPLSQRQEFGR